MIPQHVTGNYGAAGWGADKGDAVSCIDWPDTLQSAVELGGSQQKPRKLVHRCRGL